MAPLVVPHHSDRDPQMRLRPSVGQLPTLLLEGGGGSWALPLRSPLGGLASVLVRCCSTQEDRKRTPGPADTHKPPRTTGRGQHISLVEQLHLLFLQFSPGLLLRCLFALFHFAHFLSEYFHCVQSVTSSSSPYFHSKLVRLDAPFFQNLCNYNVILLIPPLVTYFDKRTIWHPNNLAPGQLGWTFMVNICSWPLSVAISSRKVAGKYLRYFC